MVACVEPTDVADAGVNLGDIAETPALRMAKGAATADSLRLDWRAVGPFPGDVQMLVLKIVAVVAQTPDGPVQVPFELGKLAVSHEQYLPSPTYVFLPDAPVSALEIHFDGNYVYESSSGSGAVYENSSNTVTLTFDEVPRNEAYSVVIDRETVQPGAGGWELSLDMYGWQDILRVEDHMVYHDVEVERLPLEGDPTPLEWQITDPGALAMRMQFREFDLDGCGAKFELYSAVTDSWTQVTGDDVAANDGWSAWIAGDTIEARVTAPNDCGGFWVLYAQSRAWTMTDRFRARTSGETSVTRNGPFGIQAQGGAIVDTEFDRHWFRTIIYGAPAGQKQSAIGRRQGNTPPHLCGSPDDIIDYYTEDVCVETGFEFVVPYGEDDCRYSVFEGLDGLEFMGDGGVVRRVDFRGSCDAPVRHGRVTGAQDPTDGFGPVPVPDLNPCVRDVELVVSPECESAAADAYIDEAIADTDCDGLSDFVERCVLGTCWDPDEPCEQEYTAGAHDTDGDGWWDGWEVCGLNELQPGDGRTISSGVFAGPAVRDLLLEVMVADNVQTDTAQEELAFVNARFAAIRRNIGTRPLAPFGNWSPVSFGVANIIQFSGSSAPTVDVALPEFADYSRASSWHIVPFLMLNNGGNTGGGIRNYLVDDRLVNAFWMGSNVLDVLSITHEAGHSLCLTHDVDRFPGLGEQQPLVRRGTPVYGSVMAYAFSRRLEADVAPRFSEGGRAMASQEEMTETTPLQSSLSRAQHLSNFWQDPTYTAAATAESGESPSDDCALPGSRCPTGFACVYSGRINAQYQNGPDRHRVRRGQCRAITPHIDWNGNGVLDEGVVRHFAFGSSAQVEGWSTTGECDVSDFVETGPIDQERTWIFTGSLGNCTFGSQSPPPGEALLLSPGFVTTAEWCQNGREPRIAGISIPGTGRTQLSLPRVVVNPEGIAETVDHCVWVSNVDPVWAVDPYVDGSDFDRMYFRDAPSAPVCDGTVGAAEFSPSSSYERCPQTYFEDCEL